MQYAKSLYLQDKKYTYNEKLFLDFIKGVAIFMNVYNKRNFIYYSPLSVHFFNSSRPSPKNSNFEEFSLKSY